MGFDWTEYPNNDYTCDYEVFDEHTEPGTADFVFCLGLTITPGYNRNSVCNSNNPTEIFNNLQYVQMAKAHGRVIMRVRSDVETLYKFQNKVGTALEY